MVSLSVTVIKIEIILGLELQFGELSENGRCSPLQMYLPKLPHRNLCGGKVRYLLRLLRSTFIFVKI